MKMDDVSIDLEEGLASHDPAAYDDDWKQMQREYDPEDDDDDNRLNDDSAAESPDPLALAQEAMLHSQEAVDHEIEQIINKKMPSDSGSENHNNFGDDEEETAQQYDPNHSKQVYYDEEEYDAEEQQSQELEAAEPIHPDLIAAAQEMGLDLNSEQMRELQKFIVQQNINEDSEGDGEHEQEKVEIDEQEGQEEESLELEELDENEKQVLLQYLEDEYDKNP